MSLVSASTGNTKIRLQNLSLSNFPHLNRNQVQLFPYLYHISTKGPDKKS